MSEDTEAGNYFVANYPPFSFWGEQDVACVDSLLNSPLLPIFHWDCTYISHFAAKGAISVIFVSTLTRILPKSAVI